MCSETLNISRAGSLQRNITVEEKSSAELKSEEVLQKIQSGKVGCSHSGGHIRQIEEWEMIHDSLAQLALSRASRDPVSEELRRHSLINALKGIKFGDEDVEVFLKEFIQIAKDSELIQLKINLAGKAQNNILLKCLGDNFGVAIKGGNVYSSNIDEAREPLRTNNQSSARYSPYENAEKYDNVGDMARSVSESDNILSDRDICNQISDAITIMYTDYLAVYERAVEAYTEFWKFFSDSILSHLAEWTTVNKDGSIKISYELINNLGFVSGYFELVCDFDSAEHAKAWAKTLGSGFYAIGCSVAVDNKDVQLMVDTLMHLGGGQGPTFKNATEYQAWLTGFNAGVENIKTNMQTITTKYSTANSMYDTIVKLLTSTISTLLESAKEYLRF